MSANPRTEVSIERMGAVWHKRCNQIRCFDGSKEAWQIRWMELAVGDNQTDKIVSVGRKTGVESPAETGRSGIM